MKTLRAFTIIETIVYLALFSILMGGAVVAAFQIFESASREQTHSILQEEGNFIMGKINWAISGAQSVSSPGGGVYGSQLSVNKVTGLDSSGQPIISTVVISISGTDITIQDGAVPVQTLNNSNVRIARLGFMHTLASGSGVNPESITASTTVTARTPNGMVLSQDFTTTIYVRR